MGNFLSGGVAELEEAKRAIIEEAEKNLAADEAKSASRAKEKELNARKMFMNDKIESTTKNRRAEIEKDHDGKIKDADRDVKEARKIKKDALSKAVSGRIKQETADLEAENRRLKKENRNLFRANKVPGFCNTKLYYALFVPRSGKDFIAFALMIIIAAALIPNVVCAFLSWKIFYKVLIYVGIVILFALIYFLITLMTKSGDRAAVLEQGRPNMKAIRKNKKEIKKLEKGIKKDRDEEQYGLGDYDAEISRREGILADRNTAKDNALEEFDRVTSVQIKADIEAEIVPEIEKLARESEMLKTQAADRAKEAADASDMLASQYMIYLGEKNTTCEKIDALISIINEGKAQDIQQALEILKGGSK